MYPNLYEILNAIGMDNDMWVRPAGKIAWPENAAALEAEASLLDEEEKGILAAGEQMEQEAVVEKHGCGALNAFLAIAFNSDDTPKYFRR